MVPMYEYEKKMSCITIIPNNFSKDNLFVKEVRAKNVLGDMVMAGHHQCFSLHQKSEK